jgi:hypothetical protein
MPHHYCQRAADLEVALGALEKAQRVERISEAHRGKVVKFVRLV